MRPRDLPPDRSLDRSSDEDLADSDSPRGPDGGARPPSELLDNLRLRLLHLSDNHPSAVRDADVSARGEPPHPGDSHDSDHSGDSHHSDDAGEVADHGERKGNDEDSPDDAPAHGGGASLTDLIQAIKEASDGLSWATDDAWPGELELFNGGGSGDPYRPWFMSGEPGTPWFVASEDL